MKRSTLCGYAVAAFALVVPEPAAAQKAAPASNSANRLVRMVMPQAAGGGDTVARALAHQLSEAWGQQVIVDDRPGANGIHDTQ